MSTPARPSRGPAYGTTSEKVLVTTSLTGEAGRVSQAGVGGDQDRPPQPGQSDVCGLGDGEAIPELPAAYDERPVGDPRHGQGHQVGDRQFGSSLRQSAPEKQTPQD